MKRFKFFLIIYFIILFAMVNPGCYQLANETLLHNDIESTHGFKILSIRLVDESEIFFDSHGGRYFFHESGAKKYCAIIGVDTTNKFVEINLNRVLSLNIEQSESTGALKTLGIFMQLPLISLSVVLLGAISGANCPGFYIQSDKEIYNLETQLLQGAFTSIGKRSEKHLFESISARDSIIRIMIRNDNLEEKQYLDKVRLMGFLHADTTTIINDENNSFYEIFESDTIYRESSSLQFTKTGSPLLNPSDQSLYDSIYLEIPCKESDSAQLIISGSSLFGVNEAMNLLIGSKTGRLEAWYQNPIDNKNEINDFLNLTSKSGINRLLIKQMVNNEYVNIPGMLPFNTIKEDKKIITIFNKEKNNVSIKLLITPPKLFWDINTICIAKSTRRIVPTELKMINAFDHGNNARIATLSKEDNKYFIMPDKNDHVLIKFENSAGYKTYALEVSGYYEVYKDKIVSNKINTSAYVSDPEKLLLLIHQKFSESTKNIYCDLP